MKKIKRTSLLFIVFYLFSITCFLSTIQGQVQRNTQEEIKSNICPLIKKKLQIRILGLKKVHKGMNNAISSLLPSVHIDRYNRYVNILEGNLKREVKLMKNLIVEMKQQDKKCQEMVQGFSPHIHKLYDTQISIHSAIFDGNSSKYKKLIEKLGMQVKNISDEL